MPTLPWKNLRPAEPGREYLLVANRTAVDRYRVIPKFLLQSMRVRRQILRTPGVVGFSMRAQLLRKTFLTVSAWEDTEARNRFLTAAPHTAIAAHFLPSLRDPVRFERPAIGTQLPPRWRDVIHSLDTAGERQEIPHAAGR